jgi:hypothetical protein
MACPFVNVSNVTGLARSSSALDVIGMGHAGTTWILQSKSCWLERTTKQAKFWIRILFEEFHVGGRNAGRQHLDARPVSLAKMFISAVQRDGLPDHLLAPSQPQSTHSGPWLRGLVRLLRCGCRGTTFNVVGRMPTIGGRCDAGYQLAASTCEMDWHGAPSWPEHWTNFNCDHPPAPTTDSVSGSIGIRCSRQGAAAPVQRVSDNRGYVWMPIASLSCLTSGPSIQ